MKLKIRSLSTFALATGLLLSTSQIQHSFRKGRLKILSMSGGGCVRGVSTLSRKNTICWGGIL